MKRASPVFTKEQLATLQPYEKSLCISAGAGSGKTAVLVERYLKELLERGRSPREILAITFTRKAAAEMKTRIRSALLSSGRLDLLRELEYAHISTIDSFAVQLLKEHPVEAGIDPHFSVFEGVEVDLERTRILDAVLETHVAEPEVRELLYLYNEDAVREAICHVYDFLGSRGLSVEEALNRPAPSAADPERSAESLINDMKKLTQEMCAEVEKEKPALYANLLLLARALETAAKKSFNEVSWEDITEIEKRSSVLKRQGKKTYVSKVEVFRSLRDAWLGEAFEAKSKPVRAGLSVLVQAFCEAYDSWKDVSALLDFNDLLIKAIHVLSSEKYAAGAYYQQQFKLIMIDESQDISPMQDRFISLLGRDNLFLVGDEKQSIYGFRDADVELFTARRERFRSGEEGVHLSLGTNFRSRPELVSFVNMLFSQCWKEDEPDFSFAPLAAHPEAGRIYLPRSAPAVEWLVPAGDETEETLGETDEVMQASRYREARLVRERITELVEKEHPLIFDKETGKERPCRFGDIGILLRTQTALPVFEHALREAGIPYYVMSGYGFFQQIEVRDVLSFLTMLENPTYDIAVAGVLRAPFVGLSDEALFWLGRYGDKKKKTKTFYDTVCRYERVRELSEDDRFRLKNFLVFQEKLSAERHRMNLSELIETILSRTRYREKLWADWNAQRRLANVDKLVDLARQFEAGAQRSVSDFVRFLRELDVDRVEEPEAQAIDERDEVVKIFTVHKAKGLEFPIVFLADLGYAAMSRSDWVAMDRAGRTALKVRNPLTGAANETPAFTALKEEKKRRERAEAKRLFYVAATRARERLIFTGAPKKKGDLSEFRYDELASWADWLRKAFGWQEIEPSEKPQTATVEGHAVRLVYRPMGAAGDAASEAKKKLLADQENVKAFFENETADPKVLFPECTAATWKDAAARVHEVSAAAAPFFETLDLSVTSLLSYEVCPRLFYYKHILSMPEPPSELSGMLPEAEHAKKSEADAGAETDPAPRPEANVFGDVIHRLLATIGFDAEFASNLARKLPFFTRTMPAEAKARAEAMLAIFAQSNFFRDLKRARGVFREFPFRFPVAGPAEKKHTLRGVIDLVFETADGKWVLADYKTVGVEKEALPDKVERYRLQMMLYAEAMRRLTWRLPDRAELVFLNETYCEVVPLAAGPDEVEATCAKVERMFSNIASGAFQPALKVGSAAPCDYCLTPERCSAEPHDLLETVI